MNPIEEYQSARYLMKRRLPAEVGIVRSGGCEPCSYPARRDAVKKHENTFQRLLA